jgi:mono/diheme cytochrome c family protein
LRRRAGKGVDSVAEIPEDIQESVKGAAGFRLRQGISQEEIMGIVIRMAGLVILMSFAAWRGQQSPPQEKPKETAKESPKETPKEAPAAQAAPLTADAADKKNPVKPTPEGLAASKKIFGYDCTMCHGANGDGKGDLVESMSLKMKDWHDSTVLEGLSDREIYDLIVKGKDKMVGEGDRLAPAKVWGLVNYVRSLAKK